MRLKPNTMSNMECSESFLNTKHSASSEGIFSAGYLSFRCDVRLREFQLDCINIQTLRRFNTPELNYLAMSGFKFENHINYYSSIWHLCWIDLISYLMQLILFALITNEWFLSKCNLGCGLLLDERKKWKKKKLYNGQVVLIREHLDMLWVLLLKETSVFWAQPVLWCFYSHTEGWN